MSKIPTTKTVGYDCKNCQFYNIKKGYCSYMKIHVGANDCKGYYYAAKSDTRHCSECIYFWSKPEVAQMYCCYLKKRITARKKPCRNYKTN